MTSGGFCNWVNITLLPKVLEIDQNTPPKITERTTRRWLHWLGFELRTTKNGVYIDGHERADVVSSSLQNGTCGLKRIFHCQRAVTKP